MLSVGHWISRMSGSTKLGTHVEFSTGMHQLLTGSQCSLGPQSISFSIPSKQIKYFWQSYWFAKKIILFGSFTSGHKFVSKSQSESSRRTHFKREREKYNPELQILSTGVPSKHKKYRVHENGFARKKTWPGGHEISVGSWVVVRSDEVVVVTTLEDVEVVERVVLGGTLVVGWIVVVVRIVVVVVGRIVVVGAKLQFTFSGKSQILSMGLNQKGSGQFWRKKNPFDQVNYDVLRKMKNIQLNF